MEFRRKMSPGDAIPAKVARIVPDRLVYIETSAPKEIIACTPNNFALKQSDGTIRQYRGESFAEIGVKVGADVKLIVDGSERKKVVFERPKAGFFSKSKYFGLG